MRTLKHKVTVENFIKWINGLPAPASFRYTDHRNCPIATFLKSIGYKLVSVGPYDYTIGNPIINRRIPTGMERIIFIARGLAYDTGGRLLTTAILQRSVARYITEQKA